MRFWSSVSSSSVNYGSTFFYWSSQVAKGRLLMVFSETNRSLWVSKTLIRLTSLYLMLSLTSPMDSLRWNYTKNSSIYFRSKPHTESHNLIFGPKFNKYWWRSSNRVWNVSFIFVNCKSSSISITIRPLLVFIALADTNCYCHWFLV